MHRSNQTRGGRNSLIRSLHAVLNPHDPVGCRRVDRTTELLATQMCVGRSSPHILRPCSSMIRNGRLLPAHAMCAASRWSAQTARSSLDLALDPSMIASDLSDACVPENRFTVPLATPGSRRGTKSGDRTPRQASSNIALGDINEHIFTLR